MFERDSIVLGYEKDGRVFTINSAPDNPVTYKSIGDAEQERGRLQPLYRPIELRIYGLHVKEIRRIDMENAAPVSGLLDDHAYPV